MLLLDIEDKMHFFWNIRTGFLWIVTLSMGYFLNITYPKKEGKTCIITCKYLFSLEISIDGKLNVFEARSESPKIQEACHSFLLNISTRKTIFSEAIMKRLKTGTWSMSCLIPRREDIIPRWSQLLTTSN